MREKLYKVSVFALLCLCILGSIYTSIGIQAEENIEDKLHMKVCVNFGQLVKYNRYANVQVELENQDLQEFSGYLQAILETEEGLEECMYQTPFTIRRNTKRNINTVLPIKYGARKIQFRIANSKGAVITQVEEVLKVETEIENFYLGVVGDGREYIKNLQGMVLKTIEIQEDELPEEEEGLDIFEAILISDQYMEQSSLEKISTIRSWCKTGGIVMIGKMDIAAKNFFGVSYKPSEVVKNRDGEKIYQIYEMEDGILVEWIHCEDFLNDIKNAPEYVENCIYDITTYYSSFTKKRHYREECLNNSAEIQLIRSLEGGDSKYLPKAMIYGIIMVGYAFIVGPILYLLLRRRQKDVLYYIAVPIAAAVFSFTIWTVSSNTRISEPILHNISIYQYVENSSKVKEDSYFSVNVPADEFRKITMEKKTNIKMKNIATSTVTDVERQVIIEQGANNSKIELKKPLYMKSYVFESTTRQNRTGVIDYSLNFDGKSIQGSVTNNLGFELQDALLLSNYHIVKLGNLRDGQEKKIPNQQEVVNQYSYYNNMGELAKELTGINEESSKDEICNLRRYATMVYALSQECFDYTNQSYVIGYMKGKDDEFQGNSSGHNVSLVLYSLRNVKSTYEGKPLITDIETFEKVTSGHISLNERTMSSDSAIVTYHFPSGMKIDSLVFLRRLNLNTSFNGVISVLNNNTREYDTLLQEGDTLMKMENNKYITSDNKIVVKYTSSYQSSSDSPVHLPVLSAIEEVN